MSESARGKASSSNDAEDKDFACPTCGEAFGSKMGMKIHHKKSHGESIAGVEVECEECGETIRRSSWDINRADHFFCSDKCQYQFQTSYVIVECANCGDKLEKNPCFVNKNKFNYCDQDCMSQHYSKRMNASSNPNWQGGTITKECEICKSNYEVEQYNIGNRRTCSFNCYGKLMSKERIGENHPLWKGGTEGLYTKKWSSVKKTALKRDNYECQICGSNESSFGAKPDVHHIKPVRTFEDPNDAHTLDNVITLCRSCHSKWEGIPLRPDTRSE